MDEGMEKYCEYLRKEIKDIGDKVRALKAHGNLDRETYPGMKGECIANIMLSYRHLEDARMRVGKIMQGLQGGVSKFDKT